MIAAAGLQQDFDWGCFPGFIRVVNSNFKILGAPIGDADHCDRCTTQKSAEAEKLLQACVEMEDTQSALLIIRHCTSYCKLVYAMRTVPPCMQRDALANFQETVRRSLSSLVGGEVKAVSAEIAKLGIRHGGLGLRDASEHAAAAYVASFLQCRGLAELIDPQFDITDGGDGSPLKAAETEVRAKLLEPDSWTMGERDSSQKYISSMIDAKKTEDFRSDQSIPQSYKCHLRLNALLGSGAWITAPPASDGRDICSSLFKTTLKRRLRVPISDHDFFCPCCGEVMDRFGDHALVCACKGSRTVRHNAVRNVVYEEALAAGIRAQKEKTGLLPSRPAEDGIQGDQGARRPADVWVPHEASPQGEAWDFACTSGMRTDRLIRVGEDPATIFEDYEQYKRSYKNTDRECQGAGITFRPLVIEAHGGGWSSELSKVVGRIASLRAAVTGEESGHVALRIAQRISCTLQRENARAVLARTQVVENIPPPDAWADLQWQ